MLYENEKKYYKSIITINPYKCKVILYLLQISKLTSYFFKTHVREAIAHCRTYLSSHYWTVSCIAFKTIGLLQAPFYYSFKKQKRSSIWYIGCIITWIICYKNVKFMWFNQLPICSNIRSTIIMEHVWTVFIPGNILVVVFLTRCCILCSGIMHRKNVDIFMYVAYILHTYANKKINSHIQVL